MEKLIREVESKTPAKEFDQHVNITRTAMDEMHKDLLLRATIKDVCTLLDEKANVEDINSTLALVQKEVEKRAGEDALKKALNDQALVNEALCA
jgi:molecular chaperone DnaK (HSP70)